MKLSKQGNKFKKINLLQDLRVLIIRPDRIGDVVLSTPLPKVIKNAYPDSYVAVMLSGYTKAIYEHNPFVDDIIITNNNFFSELREIRKHRFTHAFMLLPTEYHNYLIFAAGIWTRIGVGHKFYQFITNTKSVFRNKYRDGRSESDYCLDMARKIGIDFSEADPSIFLSDDERKERKKRREELAPNGELLIGIHTTSGKSAPNMQPAEYASLIGKLTAYDGVRVIVTDTEIPAEVDGLPEVLYPNRGCDLRTSIQHILTLDILISASTGPMHIAAAGKVPTLSLFCPLPACSPRLWGPQGNLAGIILPDPGYCEKQCPGDPKICSFEGEGGISAETVFQRVKSFIGKFKRNKVMR